jgi:hypothetical protein
MDGWMDVLKFCSSVTLLLILPVSADEMTIYIDFPTYYFCFPVPVAERSEARTVFDRSNSGIMGSNPPRGMDLCPRFSVLCCTLCR